MRCLRPMFLLACVVFFTAASPFTPSKGLQLRNEKEDEVDWEDVKKKDRVTVFIFMASTCPVTTLHLERIKGLWYNYRNKDVLFYGVLANSDDSIQVFHKRLEEMEMEMPLLWDEGHQLARALKMEYTPEVVVLGRNGEILYRGRIDDSWRDETKVRERYLDRAITAALDGKSSPDQTDHSFMGSRIR